MTQLEFFDMQEEQQKTWETKKQLEAELLARGNGKSAAEVGTEAHRNEQSSSSAAAAASSTEFFDISDEHQQNMQGLSKKARGQTRRHYKKGRAQPRRKPSNNTIH